MGLGTFDLTGIPPAPRSTPQIEVTFQVNADGMLEVNAKDKASYREEKIVINKNSNSLSPEDIEKMLADAEKFAEEDREVADRVTAKNELEGLCYSLKKQAEDKEGLGGKLSESDKEKVLEVVEEKLTWLRENGDDAAAEELKTQKKAWRRCRSRSSLVSTSRRGTSPLPRNTILRTSCRHLAPRRCPSCKETLYYCYRVLYE